MTDYRNVRHNRTTTFIITDSSKPRVVGKVTQVRPGSYRGFLYETPATLATTLKNETDGLTRGTLLARTFHDVAQAIFAVKNQNENRERAT